jgi:MFS family permease
VEHSCQQCGVTIEDGRPFCPQCRAPQIHVLVASAELPASPSLISPDGLAPDFSLEPALPSSHLVQAGSRRILDRRSAVRAALKAGVLGVFIGALPFLGIILTGYLAVYFYRRERGLVPVAALSSRVGGAAGVVAFAINALLMTIRIFVFHAQQEYIGFLTQIAGKMGADPADPNIQAGIRNLFTPAGLAASLFFWMLIAVALASIGGALASFFLRTRNPSP